MINLVPTDSHLSIRLLEKRRLPAPQVAEEEGENLEASPEEEEVEDESMDEAEGSLPSLGKRRSTDTALSGQTSAKRSRPGSLAEVSLPALRKKREETSAPFGVDLMRSQVLHRPAQVSSFKCLTICAAIPVSTHPSICSFGHAMCVVPQGQVCISPEQLSL